MASKGIVQEYKIIHGHHPHYGKAIIYYSDFDRYYREDEKVRRNTGISRDAVENEWETYRPLFAQKISALFNVPSEIQKKVCKITCYDRDDYLKQVAELTEENGWTYQGVCGASMEHHWFRKLFTRKRESSVKMVYMEEINLAELERLIQDENYEDESDY
jgi:hypothetical protein